MSDEKMIFEQFVSGSTAEVYLAFTNATLLRRWMCDVATTSPKVGGRFYMAWNSGYYACGDFIHLEADRALKFSWYGRGDPAATQVEVDLTRQDGRLLVHLVHSGLGGGPDWASTRQQVETGWNRALENLASVFATGEDERITMRPMLGVLIGEFNAAVANELGVPTSKGLRLSGTVEGLGAHDAGLGKDDVLVSMDGQALADWNNLTTTLQRHRAGDKIPVSFYRGSDLMQIELTLSRRQIPDIPWTIQGLTAAVKETYAGMAAELDQLFEGVSEAEAGYHPAPGAWGFKEILAHLIHGERYTISFIVGAATNQEQWADGDFEGNPQFPIDATVEAFSSLPESLTELKHLYTEIASLCSNLPQNLLERKASYWYLAYNLLQPQYHFQEHMEEIRGLIAAARGA